MQKFVMLAIAACFATSGRAEPPIGSRLGDRMVSNGPQDQSSALRHAHELASCTVNRLPTESKRLLNQTTADGYAAARKSLYSIRLDCFTMFDDATHVVEGRKFVVPEDILRGLLAEELIKRDMQEFAALPVLPRQPTYARAWYGASGRDVAVNEMATCVSEIAPTDILALLKSEPRSDAEGAAIGTLAPHLGECLRAGTKLDANRESLRAALADALYERVANPAGASPTLAPASGKGPGSAH